MLEGTLKEALKRAGLVPPEKTKAEKKAEIVAQWQKPLVKRTHKLVKGGRKRDESKDWDVSW